MKIDKLNLHANHKLQKCHYSAKTQSHTMVTIAVHVSTVGQGIAKVGTVHCRRDHQCQRWFDRPSRCTRQQIRCTTLCVFLKSVCSKTSTTRKLWTNRRPIVRSNCKGRYFSLGWNVPVALFKTFCKNFLWLNIWTLQESGNREKSWNRIRARTIGSKAWKLEAKNGLFAFIPLTILSVCAWCTMATVTGPPSEAG